MAIIQKEDPRLRHQSEHVSLADIPKKAMRDLIEKMKLALRAEPSGIGLAAVQIGVPKALFIVSRYILDPEKTDALEDEEAAKKKKETEEYLVFINPRITKQSRKKEIMTEGCLSVRGAFGKIKRSTNVTIEAYDEHGKKFTRGAGGLFAQVLQHETDHLNGILFVDHALTLEKLKEEK
ncbi:MAG: peptide deformylase [Candidatus Niyogibacteria bacterium]|nr:peptide deformylase [Candidatus Niyogibacteria bacterium]